MAKYQEEYIKLLDKKFGVVGKPKGAYYSYGKTPDIGILVEKDFIYKTKRAD